MLIRSFLAIVLFATSVQISRALESDCYLATSGRFQRISQLGQFDVYDATNDALALRGVPEFQRSDLDRTKFNRNTLIEMRDSFFRRWYFRFGGDNFDQTSRLTYFYTLVWSGNAAPPKSGRYTFWTTRDIAPPIENSTTLAMIGDSLTWWNFGQKFRCLLQAKISATAFVGSRTDIYGFGHEGEGGNTTGDILSRFDQIVPAASYLMLAGTNDLDRLSPETTVLNLKEIVRQSRFEESEQLR